MDAVRQVSCSDRAALARETARFVADALASHPGRFVALAVGDSTLPLYAGLDAIGPAWAGRSIMPVDELVPTPADPDRRFSARLAAALPGELRRRLIPIEVEGDPQLRAIALDARLRAEGLAAVVLGLHQHLDAVTGLADARGDPARRRHGVGQVADAVEGHDLVAGDLDPDAPLHEPSFAHHPTTSPRRLRTST